ncbi:hypothetical protein F5Y09DRAFT_344619 [Xylaria sp. FL1042]|nr:hypothetical protein F5Y09DRAFT_344619 [Xylaria sp. FL1042]
MSGPIKSYFSVWFIALVILSQWILPIHSQSDPTSCCTGDDCDADDEGLELNEIQVSITADLSPGIGAEFETGTFYLVGNPQCTYQQTDQLKGRVLGGRKGDNWELTVDTTLDMPNRLQAEYILNGQTIKIGQGMAGQAAADIAADLMNWNPSSNSPGMTVEGLDGYTWIITPQSVSLGSPANFIWQRQITAPLPLEALNDLIGNTRKDYPFPPKSLLPQQSRRNSKLVYVSTEFFQAFRDGTPNAPASDVLGFFSLVVSYAKAADSYQSGRSPKFEIPIMPRNDFQTMFNLIRSGLGSSLSSGDSALYNIVKTLSCYKWFTDDYDSFLEIDQLYCGGTIAAPEVGPKMDQLSYQLTGGAINPPPSFTIKEWMDDLQANRGDRMSYGDKAYDGQIGGFGDKMEYALGTTRLVPLFEFRDLGGSVASQFQGLVVQAENEIIGYHRQFANSPTTPSSKMAKRHVKRQPAECPASNTLSTASITSSIITTMASFTTSFIDSATPTLAPTSSISCSLQDDDPDQGITSRYCVCDTSVTAPVLGSTLARSELCAYTALPTTTAQVTLATQIWTSNCKACTLVGGIADDATCTSVSSCTPTSTPVPTMSAWVNNLATIDIGDADDGNGGKDLATTLFNKIRTFCNDTGCQFDMSASMDHVETILGDGETEVIHPVMVLDDAVYGNDTKKFEKMLALGITTWTSVLNNDTNGLCKEVEYEADEDETGSGCGVGPIPIERLRRKIHRDTGQVLWQRDDLALQERCRDTCDNPHVCHYTGRVCSAPTHIVVAMGGPGSPYEYHIGLEVQYEKTGDGFSCEEIIDLSAEILEVIDPELLRQIEELEIIFDAICDASQAILSAKV